jgi:3-deoxy-manno-octulosonate cytidylyltransferase (CMP-KDO synthetase)
MPTIIIPARAKSSRFPNKPLAKIAGVTMIERVWKQCKDTHLPVYVATDTLEIKNHCESFGAQCLLTSPDCLTGTDRVAESATYLKNEEFFINVQGDEPLVHPNDILLIAKKMIQDKNSVWNAFLKISNEEEFFSASVAKVVFNKKNELLYISRGAIPSNKNKKFSPSFKQICIYGFHRKHLELFSSEKIKSPLEEIEDIEILRFLEHGVKIRMEEIFNEGVAVDFPEDIKKAEELLARKTK